MHPRDYDMSIPHRSEGQPLRLVLKHRKTGIVSEGVGEDYDTAKAQALKALEKEVGE